MFSFRGEKIVSTNFFTEKNIGLEARRKKSPEKILPDRIGVSEKYADIRGCEHDLLIHIVEAKWKD